MVGSGLAGGTLRAKTGMLRRFLAFLAEAGLAQVAALSSADVSAYVRSLAPLAASTRAGHLYFLREYLRFAVREHGVDPALGAMFPGRFWLGLGAGEALNGHVVGSEWPEASVRSAMLFEAIEVINKLFTGNVVEHRGEHFKLESAKRERGREEAVEVLVATAGTVTATRPGQFSERLTTLASCSPPPCLLFPPSSSFSLPSFHYPSFTPHLIPLPLSYPHTYDDSI